MYRIPAPTSPRRPPGRARLSLPGVIAPARRLPPLALAAALLLVAVVCARGQNPGGYADRAGAIALPPGATWSVDAFAHGGGADAAEAEAFARATGLPGGARERHAAWLRVPARAGGYADVELRVADGACADDLDVVVLAAGGDDGGAGEAPLAWETGGAPLGERDGADAACAWTWRGALPAAGAYVWVHNYHGAGGARVSLTEYGGAGGASATEDAGGGPGAIAVGPNPAREELWVRGVPAGTRVTVYDVNESVCAQGLVQASAPISVDACATGVLVVRASGNVTRVIKQ